MNWISARCSRASGPVSTVKRAPEILPAAAKSIMLQLLAELDVIARLEVELAAARPSGGLRRSRFRRVRPARFRAACSADRAPGRPAPPAPWRAPPPPPPARAPSVSTCFSSGAMSWPCAFALPTRLGVHIALVAQLIRAHLPFLARLFERVRRATSSVKPRRARLAATAAGSERSSLGSSMTDVTEDRSAVDRNGQS